MSRSMPTKMSRGDRAYARQAEHEAALDRSYRENANDPLTKAAAFVVCQSVYRATGCACSKRPDMEACSSMVLAASAVIRMTRDWTGPRIPG